MFIEGSPEIEPHNMSNLFFTKTPIKINEDWKIFLTNNDGTTGQT